MARRATVAKMQIPAPIRDGVPTRVLLRSPDRLHAGLPRPVPPGRDAGRAGVFAAVGRPLERALHCLYTSEDYQVSISKYAMAGTFAVVMLSGPTAFAACKIATENNLGGQVGVLQANDYLRFYPEGQSGGLPARKERTFNDPSWHNKISSVEMPSNCKAVFFMSPGSAKKGHVVVAKTTMELPEEINDKTHGLICECK